MLPPSLFWFISQQGCGAIVQSIFSALSNNQPMGFYTPSVIVNVAKWHGIRIFPVDIERSEAACIVIDQQNIRLGFHYVRSVGDAAMQRLLVARKDKPFRNLRDLALRARLSERTIEHLIQAGSLDSFGKSRCELVWELGKIRQIMALG